MTQKQKFQLMLKDLQMSNQDFADKSGLAYRTIVNAKSKSAEVPAWMRVAVEIWQRTKYPCLAPEEIDEWLKIKKPLKRVSGYQTKLNKALNHGKFN